MKLAVKPEHALCVVIAAKGYPDAWHRWRNADLDANYAVARSGNLSEQATERAEWR